MVPVLILALANIREAKLEAQTQPITIEAALKQPSFTTYSPILLSPDGRWVAYTVTTPHSRMRSHEGSAYTETGVSRELLGVSAWIANVHTGQTIRVADAKANSWVPSWSPNGERAAFYSDEGGVAGLWVWDVATQQARKVSDAIVRVVVAHQAPRWMPDGRHVITPIVQYGSKLPEAAPTPIAGLQSENADSSATVRVLRVDVTQPYGGTSADVTQHEPHAGDMFGAYKADLAAIDVETGAVTTLAHGYRPFGYRASPDGHHVAFTSIEPFQASSIRQNRFSLFTVEIDASIPHAPRAIARDEVIADLGRSMEWAPDGASLLYSTLDSSSTEHYRILSLSTERVTEVGIRALPFPPAEQRASIGQSLWWNQDNHAFYVALPHQLMTVSMPNGRVQSVVTISSPYSLLTLVGSAMRGIAWSAGRQSIVTGMVRDDSTKNAGFAQIDVEKRSWKIVHLAARSYGARGSTQVDVGGDDRPVVVSESAQQPPDIWSASAEFSTLRQVTHLAPELERARFGTTRLIRWVTSDGVHRAGVLLLPVGYQEGKRYPLVVYPYPLLRRSDQLNTFGVTGGGVENLQLLASRGYAVLAPDVPPLQTTNQMRDLASTILSAVDRVIALGIADSTRLGIMGHSWGGYAVLALLVQSSRFRAAIMRGGYGDRVFRELSG